MDAFTASDVRALFRLDSSTAQQHARCGPRSACRRDALAKVDEDLDAYLALALPGVRTARPSPIPG